jgi:hypothetical protein
MYGGISTQQGTALLAHVINPDSGELIIGDSVQLVAHKEFKGRSHTHPQGE